MLKRVLSFGLVLAVLGLAGCFFIRSGQPPGLPPSALHVIEGYVTKHAGGEPVTGATVKALPITLNTASTLAFSTSTSSGYQAGSRYGSAPGTPTTSVLTTLTDEHGYFRLFVPEGVYALEARKEGHATSRVEGLRVRDTTRVDIVQKPVASPSGSTEPPRVTVSGISQGMTISGPLPVAITAESENGIKWISAALGGPPLILSSYFLEQELPIYPGPVFSQTSHAEFTLDPAQCGTIGDTTFEVVVYDGNNNRLHLILEVHVVRDIPGPEPSEIGPPRVAVPQEIVCQSVTFSKALDLYSVPLQSSLQMCAAPPGTNLLAVVGWLPSLDEPNITGYRIYRKIGHEENFRLIATVGIGREFYEYVDTSPDLKVGVPITYRVTAYRSDKESDYLEGTTTPLPPWEVVLLEPAHGATGVSLTPTFRWQAQPPMPGYHYEYVLLIIDPNKQMLPPVRAWLLMDTNEFTVPADEALAPNTSYEWLFLHAIVWDDPYRPTTASYAALTAWSRSTSEGWWWQEMIPSPRAQFTTGSE